MSVKENDASKAEQVAEQASNDTTAVNAGITEEIAKIIEEAKEAAKTAAEQIINDAKEEAAEILNEVKQGVSKAGPKPDSVPGAVSKNEKKMREKVTIKLFKDNGKYKDDVFVSVNDERYQIRRGIEVEVPRYVAEVLENSKRQDDETMEYIDKLTEDYEQKSKGM